MSQFDESIKLDGLLGLCADKKSPGHQLAWAEFLKRYKAFIYKVVTKRCQDFNIARLNLLFSEAVDDIVCEVFERLCASDHKALRDFKAVENELQFRAYLAMIGRRAASRHLQKHFEQWVCASSLEAVQSYAEHLQPDQRWMLYQDLVGELRSQRNKGNLERDIDIFMQRTWAQLSKSIILSNPCFHDLQEHTVDVVVNRMRAYLRKKWQS